MKKEDKLDSDEYKKLFKEAEKDDTITVTRDIDLGRLGKWNEYFVIFEYEPGVYFLDYGLRHLEE